MIKEKHVAGEGQDDGKNGWLQRRGEDDRGDVIIGIGTDKGGKKFLSTKKSRGWRGRGSGGGPEAPRSKGIYRGRKIGEQVSFGGEWLIFLEQGAGLIGGEIGNNPEGRSVWTSGRGD